MLARRRLINAWSLTTGGCWEISPDSSTGEAHARARASSRRQGVRSLKSSCDDRSVFLIKDVCVCVFSFCLIKCRCVRGKGTLTDGALKNKLHPSFTFVFLFFFDGGVFLSLRAECKLGVSKGRRVAFQRRLSLTLR